MSRIFKNPFNFFKKERNASFDLLKLFAMLLVVLDHCLQRWVPGIQETQLYNFIFLTQMPLFVFVSGYFAFSKIGKISKWNEFGKAILKLAINLLLPFITFSLIVSAIHASSISSFFSYFGHIFIEPQTSLWFLWVLFWLELFFIIAVFLGTLVLKENKWGYLLIAVFFVVMLVIPFIIYRRWNIFDSKLMIYYSIFFMFGLLVRFLLNTRLNELAQKHFFKAVIFVVGAGLLALVMILRPTIIHDEETFINLALRVLGSVGSILAISTLTYYIAKLCFAKNISKFGRLSLELYFVHLLLIMIPIFNQQYTYSNTINVLVYISLYLLLVTMSLAVIVAFKTNIITDLILFGKIPSKAKEKD